MPNKMVNHLPVKVCRAVLHFIHFCFKFHLFQNSSKQAISISTNLNCKNEKFRITIRAVNVLHACCKCAETHIKDMNPGLDISDVLLMHCHCAVHKLKHIKEIVESNNTHPALAISDVLLMCCDHAAHKLCQYSSKTYWD